MTTESSTGSSPEGAANADRAVERPWLAHYPPGVEWDLPIDAHRTVVDLLEAAFRTYARNPAQENLGHTMSYRELDEQSRQLAAYCRARGLHPGDTLAIQMPNVLQYSVALFAGIRAGLRIVNINPLYTVPEMLGPLRDSNAQAIVVLANFADKLEQALPQTQLRLMIVTEIGDAISGLRRPVVNLVVKHIKKMVPRYHLPQAVSWRAALRAGARSRYERPEVRAEQTVFL